MGSETTTRYFCDRCPVEVNDKDNLYDVEIKIKPVSPYPDTPTMQICISCLDTLTGKQREPGQ